MSLSAACNTASKYSLLDDLIQEIKNALRQDGLSEIQMVIDQQAQTLSFKTYDDSPRCWFKINGYQITLYDADNSDCGGIMLSASPDISRIKNAMRGFVNDRTTRRKILGDPIVKP